MTDDDAPRSLDPARLGEIPILAGVGLADRVALSRESVLRRLIQGETLIEQGKRNARMHLVVEGALGIHLRGVDGEPIAVLGPGETVGELSLLDESPASATVVAAEPALVLSLDEDAFWRLTNASHAFAVNLLVKLAERLRANNAQVSRNVEKRRQYERAAMFDGLTGIHNRRWLDDTLHRVVARQRRTGGPLSVALIDVDHFKSFNDRFGHDAGDHVLQLVATTLAANLRPTDLVARFGGEEFVIVFPETERDAAARAADRVREAIARLEPKMADGRELPRVTISLGIAQVEAENTVADLLKAADQAMYRAKQGGRNRVEVHAGGSSSQPAC